LHVGLIGSTDPDTFADNIGDALVRMGHSVTSLGSARPKFRAGLLLRSAELARQACPGWEDRAHKILAYRARDRGCQAVITTEGRLAPAAVAEIRKNHIPVSLWFPDCVSNLGRQRMLAAPYTGLFFKDRILVQRLKDMLDLPVWHLPEACNPGWHRPIGDAGVDKHVVVAGNSYLTRLLLLERLHEAGVPLVLFGNPIPRWAPKAIPEALHTGRSIFREEKSRVFRGAAAVLNNLHPAEMSGVNARLFEAAGAGAAVLCERRPELDELFDPKREVVAFTTFDELLGKIQDLLSSSSRTRSVGDAATKRAHADHSYEVRLKILLEKMF